MDITYIIYIYFTIIFLINVQEIYCSIICKRCKTKLFEITSIMEMKSSLALNSKRKKLYNINNVLTQVFATPLKMIKDSDYHNPHKIYIELIITSAGSLYCNEQEHAEGTFFKGYSWSECQCPFCGKRLGFKYVPNQSFCSKMIEVDKDYNCKKRIPFFGLITSRIESSYAFDKFKLEL